MAAGRRHEQAAGREPQAIAEAVAMFFGNHEVASLTLPSGWFGRRHDNWHPLTEVSTDGDLLLTRLDEKQCLELDAAEVSVDGRAMSVVIRSGAWDWTVYGGAERHHEELSPGAVELHAPFH